MLNVIMLSLLNLISRYPEYRYAECYYAECRHAECRGASDEEKSLNNPELQEVVEDAVDETNFLPSGDLLRLPGIVVLVTQPEWAGGGDSGSGGNIISGPNKRPYAWSSVNNL
jgi:hypothetical protein